MTFAELEADAARCGHILTPAERAFLTATKAAVLVGSLETIFADTAAIREILQQCRGDGIEHLR